VTPAQDDIASLAYLDNVNGILVLRQSGSAHRCLDVLPLEKLLPPAISEPPWRNNQQ